jgi:quercetin dioxygenase-like cupin family protein
MDENAIAAVCWACMVHRGMRGKPGAQLLSQGNAMNTGSGNTFSHVRPGDTQFREEGLRNFFMYRDLGIAEATGGRVIAQLVKAKNPPVEGTGWHIHEAQFHIVYMLKGWARFMYEDQETLVNAGDCVHQRPGIRHFLFDYSPDMEYLEVVGPADFGSVGVEGPCAVPPPTPWA